jgi:hypothetical protein
MPTETKKNKPYAAFLKISQRGKDAAYTDVKYLSSLEKAKKVAMHDFLSAVMLAGDGDGPDSPSIDAFAGRVCKRGPDVAPHLSVTDVHKLIFDEYGEVLWLRLRAWP